MTKKQNTPIQEKHYHKYKWIEARMYGTEYPSGVCLMCKCGKIKIAIKETGFGSVTAYEVCEKGEFHKL